MGATINALTIAWVVGIGLCTILAAFFLTNKRTKVWSEKRIVLTSSLISIIVTTSLVYTVVYWRG